MKFKEYENDPKIAESGWIKEWRNAPKEFFTNLKIMNMGFPSIFWGALVTFVIFSLFYLLLELTRTYPFFIFGIIMSVYSFFFLKRIVRELVRSLSVIVFVFVCAVTTIIFEKFGYNELSIFPGYLIGFIFAFFVYRIINKFKKEEKNDKKNI